MKIVPCSELYKVFMMADFAENTLCEKLEIQLCPARSFISSFWPLGGSCGHGSYQPVCPPTDPCACRSGVGQGPGVRLELSSFLGRSLVTMMVRKYQVRRGWRRGCTKWRTDTLAGGKMSRIRGRPPHRKYWTDMAAWKEGVMMTCLKEGLGMVARVGKKEKQQSLKLVLLLELEIPALT